MHPILGVALGAGVVYVVYEIAHSVAPKKFNPPPLPGLPAHPATAAPATHAAAQHGAAVADHVAATADAGGYVDETTAQQAANIGIHFDVSDGGDHGGMGGVMFDQPSSDDGGGFDWSMGAFGNDLVGDEYFDLLAL